jgi:hypothetical protein
LAPSMIESSFNSNTHDLLPKYATYIDLNAAGDNKIFKGSACAFAAWGSFSTLIGKC